MNAGKTQITGSLSAILITAGILAAALFICFIQGSLSPVLAEYEEVPVGARPLGMGGAFTGLADDVNAISWNPAGLTSLDKLEVTSMHTKLFDIDRLVMDYVAAGGHIRAVVDGWMGFAYQKMGTELYNETTYTLSFAKKLTEDHSFGINLKQMVTQIRDTPDYEGLGVDLGLKMKYNDILTFGGFVRNLNNPQVNETLPLSYRVGVAAKANENLTLTLDVDKVVDSKEHISWHLGQEFRLSKGFVVRAGYTSWPKRLHGGFGFTMYNWYVDYAFQNHQVLDNTHRISATIKFDTARIFTRKARPAEKPEPKVVLGKDIVLDAVEIPRADRIDVNAATAAELAKVPGIGKAMANNIVLFRHIHGKFKFLRDLIKVPLFTEEIYDLVKDFLTL